MEGFKKEGTEFVSSPAKRRKTQSLDFPVDLELEHVLGSMPRKVILSADIQKSSVELHDFFCSFCLNFMLIHVNISVVNGFKRKKVIYIHK